GTDFGVCVNPEFMREGTAVADFLQPAITILGAADPAHRLVLRELYSWAPGRIFETSFRSAEMVKYVCNAWHAVKVAFANEVGTLAKELGVDAEAVVEIFTADNRLNISPAYLKPGFAFGGSCLPKDVRAMNYRAKELDLKLPLFEAILPSNELHLQRAVEMVLNTGKKKIAMLGLSFKAATDDLRESPQVQLVKRLLGEGRQIQIWDDNVSLGRLIGSNRQYIEDVIPHIGSLLSSNLEQVLENAEVVIVGTRGIHRDEAYEQEILKHLPGTVTIYTAAPDVTPLERYLDYVRRLPWRAPYAVSKFTAPEVQRLLREWLSQRRFDVAVCDFLSSALNFPRQLATPTVLFQHNVETVLWKRKAQFEVKWLDRMISKIEYAKMVRFEPAQVRRFHHLIAVSEQDRQSMSWMCDLSHIS